MDRIGYVIQDGVVVNSVVLDAGANPQDFGCVEPPSPYYHINIGDTYKDGSFYSADGSLILEDDPNTFNNPGAAIDLQAVVADLERLKAQLAALQSA